MQVGHRKKVVNLGDHHLCLKNRRHRRDVPSFAPWSVSAVIVTASLVLSVFVDRHTKAPSISGPGFVTTTSAFVIAEVAKKHGYNNIIMSSSSSSKNHFHRTGNHQLQEDPKILPTPTKRNVEGRLPSSSSSPTSVVMMTMMPGSNAETTGDSEPCGDDKNDGSLFKEASVVVVSPNSVGETNPRSCILQVGAYAGQLCHIANTNDEIFSPNNEHGRAAGESTTTCLVGDDGKDDTAMVAAAAATTKTTQRQQFVDCLAMLTYSLWSVSKSLNLHLEQSIQNKLHLNAIKYPVEHCKVRGWILLCLYFCVCVRQRTVGL